MTSRLRQSIFSAILALLLCTPIFIPSSLRAQEHSATPQARGPQLALILRNAGVEARGPQLALILRNAGVEAQSPGREPAPATGEVKGNEKGGEESNPVRNSPAVRWLAQKTGLTLDQAYWLCIGINFAAVFLFIVVMLRKKLPGFFSGRTAAIQKGIEEARKMSEEARARLTEVEGRLSRLGADIAAMRNEADENAKAEEKRIQQSSEEERQRIVSSAQQEIDMAANAARRDLKAYAGQLAVNLAEKKIRVDKNADEALVREFTTRLGKDGE